MKYVDHTFVENSWMYEYLQKEVGSDKVSFAPPGVDTQLYKPAVGGISEAPYILSVGRFSDPRKNTRMLFEAYKKLLDSNPDVPKRSEEHTSELQSRGHLVCRLLLDKEKDRHEQYL